MDCTFGIITSNRVNSIVIDSIKNQNIENFEIIIVGGENTYMDSKINHIQFDESIKTNWITRKKNIITENAKYENIIYMHDYLLLDPDWYENQKDVKFFDVCMNRILNSDGSRFRDWCAWDDPDICFRNGHSIILPNYDYSKVEYMYISGSYWISKKEFMLKNKLDENLSWGEGEDVEWSKRIRDNLNYVINDRSIIRLNKFKSLSAIYIKDIR
jgi:hypothetical protein